MIRSILYPAYFCLFAVIFVTSEAQTNYCSIKCKPNEKQSLCQYPHGYGQRCNKVIRAGLTSDEKKRLLAKHNELRAFVASGKEKRGSPGPQPASDNMENMVWDDEVANLAQAWANQCDYNHDKCRKLPRFSVGQNIALSWSSAQRNVDVVDFVESWYNEVKDFNRAEVQKFTGENYLNIGHYTQIVWANSKSLGCGLMEYLSTNNQWNTFLVCDYGPSGNVVGEQVYHIK
ncbi:venom allergen 5-like [Prorops nasuta]|uniref:venom allergen 5-like n=1 Tax=Prorops nasuta TaxID=863751 RepID=UPI0034CE7810